MKPTFKKRDLIRHENKNWQCIVADHEVAVFGKVSKIEGGGRTSYQNTFVVSNMKSLKDDFQYTRI